MEVRQKPIFNKIKYWVDTYGSSGAEDKRAIADFVECEAREAIVGLRNELFTLAQGSYDEAALNVLIGPNRKDRHGSYNEWAKIMLQWLAAHKG